MHCYAIRLSRRRRKFADLNGVLINEERRNGWVAHQVSSWASEGRSHMS